MCFHATARDGLDVLEQVPISSYRLDAGLVLSESISDSALARITYTSSCICLDDQQGTEGGWQGRN
jgi:hypothetical protein